MSWMYFLRRLWSKKRGSAARRNHVESGHVPRWEHRRHTATIKRDTVSFIIFFFLFFIFLLLDKEIRRWGNKERRDGREVSALKFIWMVERRQIFLHQSLWSVHLHREMMDSWVGGKKTCPNFCLLIVNSSWAISVKMQYFFYLFYFFFSM